ncbi:MAG: hypothetical protein JXQ29_12030 [Planctomycetes bacterium]|nr:hypothetical protein [Planctomycetota bacterium]
MDTNRIREMARNFWESGMKMLLENPYNVRDLLQLGGCGWVESLELDRMTCLKESFVPREDRRIESDVIHVVPLPPGNPWGEEQRLWVYILIVNREVPDPLLPFRLHERANQVRELQKREWVRTRGSLAGFRCEPVLPVALCTGMEPPGARRRGASN